MNKKLLLFLLGLVIIPAVVFGIAEPDADAIGKQFAKEHTGGVIGVHTLEEDITEQEEVRRAVLIIGGTVIDEEPYWKITSDKNHPRIFTDYTIKVDNVIKGGDKKQVKVTVAGGTLDGVKTKAGAPEITAGDEVIMVLGQSLESAFKGSYVPISISKSIYTVNEDGKAENQYSQRTGDEDVVKSRLAELASP